MADILGFRTEAPPATEAERVIALAKLIRTPAQLDAVLADVQPELYDSVKAMLETLIVFDEDAPHA